MCRIQLKVVRGTDLLVYSEALARLRITVFRDWPYLYEGSLEYERGYLKKYAACPDSVVALALDGDEVVGASTALPLTAADSDFQNAFRGSPYEIESIFYLGESVLLPEYRGQGLGHQFFDAREAQAVRCGARYTAFCAVERSMKDPRRPANYQALDPFWTKRGYRKHPRIQAIFDWRETGESLESEHHLSFWMKEL